MPSYRESIWEGRKDRVSGRLKDERPATRLHGRLRARRQRPLGALARGAQPPDGARVGGNVCDKTKARERWSVLKLPTQRVA